MTRSLWTSLMRHLRVGYVSGLLFIDGLAVLVLGYDLFRFNQLDLSFPLAFRASWAVAQTYVGRYCLFIVLLLLGILPLFVAIFRVLAGPYPRASQILGRRHKPVVILHLVAALTIGYSPAILTSMSVASGYKGTVGLSYAFSSYLLQIESFLFVYGLGYAVTVGFFLITALLAVLIAGSDPPKYLKDYDLRLSLADLGGELYPITGRHFLNFNMPAIAPEIRYVRKKAEETFRRYQERIPGSEASAKYITNAAIECRTLLKQLLIPTEQQNKFSIEFFSTTSRALEVAINRILEPKRVVLSPFEHPTEAAVSKWACYAAGSDPAVLKWDSSDYEEKWTDQKAKAIDQITHALSSGSDATNLLIISEVCYATGMVIPVREVVDGVRSKCPNINLKVVVDGAHAAGNRIGNNLHGLTCCDAYVLSAHKWLMSPEPCGILLVKNAPENGLRSYDSWAEDLPRSTASVHMVAGLLASLQLVENTGFDNLWSRSDELLNYFLQRVERNSKLEVVGKDSNLHRSLMLAVRPAIGNSWRFDADSLSEYLNKRSVFALVLNDIDQSKPWVRIAFPYFLEFSGVKRLISVLDNAVEQS